MKRESHYTFEHERGKDELVQREFKLFQNVSASFSSLQQEESQEKLAEDEDVFNVENYADNVLETILRKSPNIKVIISSREGKCLTASVRKTEALETLSCVLEFTDKVKVLVKKLLGEELAFVSIKGRKNEVLVTFEELLEIITIRDEDSANK